MAWGNRSHGVNDLVTQLNQNCTADTMCVMRSRIFGDDEALVFSLALSKNSSLKNLLLNGHHISVKAAAEFGASLAMNNGLEHLTIGDDTFGDEGLGALIDAGLDRNRSITCLDFEFRSLGPSSAIKLGLMMSGESPPLKELLLSRNQLAGDVSSFGVLCLQFSFYVHSAFIPQNIHIYFSCADRCSLMEFANIAPLPLWTFPVIRHLCQTPKGTVS